MLVLLALGAGIISTGLFAPAPRSQHGSYSLSVPGDMTSFTGTVSLSGLTDIVLPERELQAAVSCLDTPPQLAMFYALPMPVNQATREDLVRLPGIGPKLADNIVAYRKSHGTFTGLQALIKVNGIGSKMAARLQPLVCFD